MIDGVEYMLCEKDLRIRLDNLISVNVVQIEVKS